MKFIPLPIGDSEAKVTLFCKLQYKEDFDVKRDSVSVNQNHCEPFNLTLTVKNLQNRVDEVQYENIFLVVKAQSVQSAYKGKRGRKFLSSSRLDWTTRKKKNFFYILII